MRPCAQPAYSVLSSTCVPPRIADPCRSGSPYGVLLNARPSGRADVINIDVATCSGVCVFAGTDRITDRLGDAQRPSRGGRRSGGSVGKSPARVGHDRWSGDPACDGRAGWHVYRDRSARHVHGDWDQSSIQRRHVNLSNRQRHRDADGRPERHGRRPLSGEVARGTLAETDASQYASERRDSATVVRLAVDGRHSCVGRGVGDHWSRVWCARDGVAAAVDRVPGLPVDTRPVDPDVPAALKRRVQEWVDAAIV